MASPVAWTARAQTVVTGRCDQGPQRRPFIQTCEFSHIACPGGLRPSLNLGQGFLRAGLGRFRAVTGLLHSVQTQVIGTALEQSHADGQAQNLHQAGYVTRKQLVLQRFGRRGHQGPLSTEQDRHQIGIGFARSCPRLDHQLTAVLHRSADRQSHVGLSLPGLKAGHRLGQNTLARQGVGHPLIEQVQAGSLGAKRDCSAAIWSRSAKRRFFMRRMRNSS